MESGADHKSLESVECDGEVSRNTVDTPNFSFEFPDHLEFLLGVLWKKAIDLAEKPDIFYFLYIQVSFEENCLVLVVVVGPIPHWNQPRVIVLW